MCGLVPSESYEHEELKTNGTTNLWSLGIMGCLCVKLET